MGLQIMLLYLLMCFSDFTEGPVIRHELGKVFVGVLSAFILVHVVIMIGGLCISVRLWCKSRQKGRKLKRMVKSGDAV